MKRQEIDPKQGFEVKNVKLGVSKGNIVSNAGFGTIIELFDKSPLSKEFAKCLPQRKSNNSHGSYRIALIMLASLIHGDDCLDDIEEEFGDNPSAEAFFKGKIPVAKTFGDFLRDFEDEHIDGLNQYLTVMGYTIRNHLSATLPEKYRPKEKPYFAVDSTVHEQHGSKIEGCAYNYNGVWCLNSEVVFDEMGIAYAGILETGNTKPGTDGPKLLDQVLAPLRGQKLQAPHAKVAHVSGDSAYGFEDFIRTMQKHHVIFTIAARKNIPWESEIEKLQESDWIEHKYTVDEILKLQKRKKEPIPKYYARWYWTPSWAENLKFPIIIKKEWKEDPVFQGAGHFHYHAVITNEDLFHNSYQSVYSRYLMRANMENFIKEAKINFDAYHLPCLNFKANHAFLLLLLIAANILRWVSLITKPEKPLYAKKLRRKFIFQAGRLVSHARQLTMKVSKKFKEEVDRLKEAWGAKPITVSPQISSA
ncbi:MAG: IS1380 family transposase [Pseudobdellovibrionaceae bacterium]